MGVYSISNRELDLTTGVIECAHEPGLEGAYHIVAESEANYNAIMQAIGVAELAVFESTGTEMVYEAGDVKGFFGKMKEFFLNLWEKIKGLFKKFFSMFDSYVKSDKDFINKYKKHLLSVNTKDFKYKGYVFTPEKINLEAAAKKIDGMKIVREGDLEAFITKFEDRAELIENMRGTVLSKGNLTAAEFTKELFSILRNGEDTKEDLENISVIDQINHISGTSGLKKAAETQYKNLEKEIRDAIKSVENAEKQLLKQVPDKNDKALTQSRAIAIKAASTEVANLRDKMAVLQIMNGAKLTAIKDCNRQAKAICVALMNYRPKNESTSVYESGFLAGVKLV